MNWQRIKRICRKGSRAAILALAISFAVPDVRVLAENPEWETQMAIPNAEEQVQGAEIPAALSGAETVIASGYAGTVEKDIAWTLTADGKLVIKGTGPMTDEPSFREYRNQITSVVISGAVTTIGKKAFSVCSNLTSISMPNTIESIGEDAFSYCQNLDGVKLPSSLKSIGVRAFFKCEKLSSVTIPSGVKEIPDYAFQACYKLEEVTVKEGVASIGAYAFCYCSELKKVKLPDSILKIGQQAFSNCAFEQFTIPKEIKRIEVRAFSYCEYLKAITIPEGVAAIEKDAFWHCLELEHVTLPETLTEIGSGAFYDCDVLREVIVPKSVVNIGIYALGYNTVYGENGEPYHRVEDFVIYGETGSGAQRYASESELTFCEIKKKAAILFEVRGGVGGNFRSVYEKNQEYGALPKVNRTGYLFQGWYTQASGGTQVTRQSICSGNGTLYAHWKAITYRIYFSGFSTVYHNSFSGWMPSMLCKYNASYELPEAVYSSVGYEFTGWYTEQDGSGTFYADRSTVKNLRKTNGANVYLYAAWKPITYKISYELAGGRNASGNPSLYTAEKPMVPLYDPTRTGYKFMGWFLEQEHRTQVTEINTGIAGDLTLYAKWKAKTYSIAFDANGGTGTMETLAKREYDKTYSLPENAFKRKGYHFLSWNTKPDGSGITYENLAKVKNLTASSGAVVTLYAIWKPKTYHIVFDANGGAGTMTALSKRVYDTVYRLPANTFVRDKYDFKGWNTKADGTGMTFADGAEVKNLSASSGAVVTLYAVWEEKEVTYTITYLLDGGTNNPGNPDCYTNKMQVTLQDPAKKGYTFAGWYLDQDYTNQVTCISLGTNGNLILYARFLPNTYKVVFKPNGGTGTDPAAIKKVPYDSEVAMPANPYTKTGYRFLGWNTKADGSGKNYKAESTAKNLTDKDGATVTLYAKWEPKKYSIVFDGNGADGGNMAALENCEYDAIYTLPANVYKNSGWIYAGWNTKKDGTGTQYADRAEVKNLSAKSGATVTLYAQWVKPK